MTTKESTEKYLEYLKTHISYVQKGYETLLEIIPDLFDGYDESVRLKTEENIKNHDKIKFEPHNLRVYGEHFINNHDEQEYDSVILNHFHNCPHHYQHWVVMYDKNNIHAVEIPYDYIIEMICDWFSFSFYHDEEGELVKWYKKCRNRMIFAPKTQIIIDNIIAKVENYYLMKGVKL